MVGLNTHWPLYHLQVFWLLQRVCVLTAAHAFPEFLALRRRQVEAAVHTQFQVLLVQSCLVVSRTQGSADAQAFNSLCHRHKGFVKHCSLFVGHMASVNRIVMEHSANNSNKTFLLISLTDLNPSAPLVLTYPSHPFSYIFGGSNQTLNRMFLKKNKG